MRKVDYLEQAINEKRNEMIRIGMTKGLSSIETVNCSQELDKLLNEYRRLENNLGKPQLIILLEDLLILFQNQMHRWVRTPHSFLIPIIKK